MHASGRLPMARHENMTGFLCYACHVFCMSVKLQSHFPGFGPGRAPISDPGPSGAIPGSSLRVRGRSVARPCTSGAIRGDPGSTPEVLKCLKHPGRSGEDVCVA